MLKYCLWFFWFLTLCLLYGCTSSDTPTPIPLPTETPQVAASPTPTRPTLSQAQAVLLVWDFAEASSLGWKPTHDLETFSFDEQGLHTFSSGGDPYMVGPHENIDAEQAYYIEIRMRSTLGNDAQLFWITQQDPRYDEAKSQHFPVKGDGDWHTYRVPLNANPAWIGIVTQLRLDPTVQGGSEIALAWIKALGPRPGEIRAKTFGPRVAVADARSPVGLSAHVVNSGDQPLAAVDLTLSLPAGLTLVSGNTQVRLEGMGSGIEQDLTWQVGGDPGMYELSLIRDNQVLDTTWLVLADTVTDRETALFVANDQIQVAFPRQPYGYGMAMISARHGDGWKQVGRLRALGELTYRAEDGQDHRALLLADRAEGVQNGLRLSGTFTDVDGIAWSGDSTFQLAADGRSLTVDTTLHANGTVQIINWTGLALYAGDGTFGAHKESALFPGVEFLLDDEPSSGTDFFNPPAHLRYVPHPNKVTVPLMSATQDGMSVGLAWDPLQKWDGTRDRPGALFAAPNTWDGQENQLMALFVPSPLDYDGENQVDSPSPYVLPAGHVLRLSARLFAVPATDSVSPMAFWLETYGLPDLPPPPRSYQEDIRLSIDATVGPTWDEVQQGWHYAIHDPWGPGSSPANELHLWLAALQGHLTDEEQVRYRDVVRKLSLRSDYVGGQPNPQFYVPVLQMHLANTDALLDAAQLARPQLVGQNAEGFWPYVPQQRSGRPFGLSGDTSSGQIAAKALHLLRFARITGDPQLRDAGLRALAYMDAHHSRRPEGAQIWELPLHCPDLLAAAWAEQCYLEAFWLTGEAHYIEQAQWWALSGLPFVYLWSAPDRPVMAYTTVPVFAATNYNYPWLGRPVMWNGLDYALGLWHLDEALDQAGIASIIDWRKVAEGITRAAMQMQPESGSYLGMYPDAWDVVIGGEAYSWWLHPFYILQNLYAMRGAGAEIQTVILRDGPQPVHINAVAEILRAERTGDRLQVELLYHAGETCVLMVNRLTQPPHTIALDGRALLEADAWSEEASGWTYRNGTLLIKVPFQDDRAIITSDS